MLLNVSFYKSDILVHLNELKCDLSAKELCGMYYFLFQLVNASESYTTCKLNAGCQVGNQVLRS